MAGELRIKHRQASLEELGQLAEPALTKDAIAGRIRRLLALADRRALGAGRAQHRGDPDPGHAGALIPVISSRQPDVATGPAAGASKPRQQHPSARQMHQPKEIVQ